MLETKATDYFSRFRTDAEIVERKKRRLEKEKEKNGTDSAKNGAVKNGGPRDKKLGKKASTFTLHTDFGIILCRGGGGEAGWRDGRMDIFSFRRTRTKASFLCNDDVNKPLGFNKLCKFEVSPKFYFLRLGLSHGWVL